VYMLEVVHPMRERDNFCVLRVAVDMVRYDADDVGSGWCMIYFILL